MNALTIQEKQMLLAEQVDIPVVHRFGPGVYIREITVPAGVFMIGHEHKTPHMSVMLEGRATVTDENGSVTEMVAPAVMNSGCGRKAAYVHEKMTWLNIHATDETDLEKLEDMLIVKSSGWIEHHNQAALTAGGE